MYQATIMLPVPSPNSTLQDLKPTLLHAVNSTKALAPEVDLDVLDEDEQSSTAPTASDCAFYVLASQTTLQEPKWTAVDAKKGVKALGLAHGQIVALAFTDNSGVFQHERSCVLMLHHQTH